MVKPLKRRCYVGRIGGIVQSISRIQNRFLRARISKGGVLLSQEFNKTVVRSNVAELEGLILQNWKAENLKMRIQ
jgi:hypothetical protein